MSATAEKTRPAAASAEPPEPTVETRGRRLVVLVVDDHEIVHWGLRLVLSRQDWVSRCVGARTGEGALKLARSHAPDVALVDLVLADESGAAVCAAIRAASPRTSILLMSGSGRISVGAARSAGASGFIPKDRTSEEIIRALHAVALGRTSFGALAQKDPELTDRQRGVLELLAEGATNREIAQQVHLSQHTVKEYVSSLYKKLGARNRADVVRLAQRHGLIG
jgi:DNA-binding NarL/FixJ family response regulator